MYIEIRESKAGSTLGNWRRSLAEAIRDPDELCTHLQLPEAFRVPARRAAGLFPLLVPRAFLDRIRTGDPHDPLLRQILPIADEESIQPGFLADPVGDCASLRAPGLLQKYHGRALLVTTGVCAVHCRYCFRRHFPYSETPRGLQQWEPALRELSRDRTISEVLLSGGDPLTMTDDWLARLVARLEDIAHLKRLRIHTRLPIVLPERINDELLAWLTNTRLTTIVVVHANHPNEIDTTCTDALLRFRKAGTVVLNQSVLLRGVNDNVIALEKLSNRLLDAGVLPYYLHQLDRVAGAAHFEVPLSQGRRLIEHLRRRLPGYAVPRYVQEIEGQPYKTVLA